MGGTLFNKLLFYIVGLSGPGIGGGSVEDVRLERVRPRKQGGNGKFRIVAKRRKRNTPRNLSPRGKRYHKRRRGARLLEDGFGRSSREIVLPTSARSHGYGINEEDKDVEVAWGSERGGLEPGIEGDRQYRALPQRQPTAREPPLQGNDTRNWGSTTQQQYAYASPPHQTYANHPQQPHANHPQQPHANHPQQTYANASQQFCAIPPKEPNVNPPQQPHPPAQPYIRPQTYPPQAYTGQQDAQPAHAQQQRATQQTYNPPDVRSSPLRSQTPANDVTQPSSPKLANPSYQRDFDTPHQQSLNSFDNVRSTAQAPQAQRQQQQYHCPAALPRQQRQRYQAPQPPSPSVSYSSKSNSSRSYQDGFPRSRSRSPRHNNLNHRRSPSLSPQPHTRQDYRCIYSVRGQRGYRYVTPTPRQQQTPRSQNRNRSATSPRPQNRYRSSTPSRQQRQTDNQYHPGPSRTRRDYKVRSPPSSPECDELNSSLRRSMSPVYYAADSGPGIWVSRERSRGRERGVNRADDLERMERLNTGKTVKKEGRKGVGIGG